MPPVEPNAGDILSHVMAIKAEQERLRNDFDRAFPRNDLDQPDIDGHRNDHLKSRADARTMDSYKVEATKRLLSGGVGFGLMLLGLGFLSYLRDKLGILQ